MTTTPVEQTIYTPAEAAKLLHVSPAYLRQLASQGRVTASKRTVGGQRRYTQADIDGAIQSGATSSEAVQSAEVMADRTVAAAASPGSSQGGVPLLELAMGMAIFGLVILGVLAMYLHTQDEARSLSRERSKAEAKAYSVVDRAVAYQVENDGSLHGFDVPANSQLQGEILTVPYGTGKDRTCVVLRPIGDVSERKCPELEVSADETPTR